MFLAFLVACAPIGGDDAGGSGATASVSATATTAWWEAPAGDADGDGFTAEDGDCDDGDPAVHPGVPEDLCGRGDEDCDGQTDEDFDADAWEPDDDEATDLGDLTDVPEVLLTAYTFPEGDVDRFRFYVEDGTFDWFDVEVWVYGIDPAVDVALDLAWTDADGVDHGVILTSDVEGPGGYESVNHGGSSWDDDSGWYEATVRTLSGASCTAPYLLQVLVGGA